MAALERIFTRALRGTGAGLGNAVPGTGYTASGRGGGATNPGRGRGGKGPIAGTRSITYNSPGQPQPLDIAADQLSQENYLGSVYVMRCVRLMAETLAASPYVVGPDPFNPGTFDRNSPLSRLLGPATPQAPGGPNPHLTARAFWIWTIVQYVTSGRWGWELQWDGTPGRSGIVGLWPLISVALTPIPIDGKADIWAGFQYQTPTGYVQLAPQRVCYAWRPAINDWRMPESVLQSANIPIYMQRSVDKYTANLLKNNMVATTMVISPPFEESEQRRAFEDQFLAEYTGVDRAGSTIFGYAEADEDDPAGKPLVQVEKLAQTAVEASLQELARTAKDDICIALGVPRSLLGDASQRIYSNAGAEYRNFWTITMINLIAEVQDHINLRLAPQVDPSMVGWFDLSKVEALQPPSIFAPPDVAEAINMGILQPEQAAHLLGIPPPGDEGDSDVQTIMVGEEATNSGAVGGRSAEVIGMRLRSWGFRGDTPPAQWVPVKRRTPMNAYLFREPEKRVQPRIELRPRIRAYEGYDQAQRLVEANAGLRAVALARTASSTVHRLLARYYPEDTISWVNDADWSGPKRVPLEGIAMDRRPGGRNMDKVAAIATKLADGGPGSEGAAAPVVLVKTPSGKLKVADGYHRTLAHRRLEHATVPAYVGEVDSEEGPWDREMHDRKLNRQDTARIPARPRVKTRDSGGLAVDHWYGYAGPDLPDPPRVVDVESVLAETKPYVIEPIDHFNGVPNRVVEEIAATLEAGGPNEDEEAVA